MGDAAETIGRAKEGFVNIVEQTRTVVNDGLTSAETGFSKAADEVLVRSQQLRQTAVRANEQARVQLARAKQGFDGVAQASSDYVSANPGRAVLGAVAAGFVLGFLLRGRRHVSV